MPSGVVRRVRHRRDRVGRRQVGDPQRVLDAAADDRLGLDDVDGTPAEELDRGAPRLEDLAARERDVERGPEVLVARVAVALAERLLEPDEPERTEDPPHLDRPRQRVAGVPVGHQEDAVGEVGPDLLEQRGLVRDRITAHPELHRGEPRREDALHVARPGVGRIDPLDVAAERRVQPNPVADRPAERRRHRDAELARPQVLDRDGQRRGGVRVLGCPRDVPAPALGPLSPTGR